MTGRELWLLITPVTKIGQKIFIQKIFYYRISFSSKLMFSFPVCILLAKNPGKKIKMKDHLCQKISWEKKIEIPGKKPGP